MFRVRYKVEMFREWMSKRQIRERRMRKEGLYIYHLRGVGAKWEKEVSL